MRKVMIGAVVLLAVLLIAVLVQQQVTRTAARDATPGAPLPGEAPPLGTLPAPGEVSPGEPGILDPPAVGDGGVASPRSPEATPPPAPGQPPAAQQPPAPAPSAVQPAPTADGTRILQAASDAYAEVRTLRAEFTMRTENPLLRTAVSSAGTLYQQRPDRIALRFTDPAGDVIIGDGQHIWVYYPSVDDRQVIRSPAGAGGAGGVDLQAQFLGDPVRRFDHTLHGTELVGGRQAHLMTLVPREPLGYSRLRVWIDTRDRLVRRFEITEQNGAVRLVELANLQTNVAVPAEVFRFTPPANARVIDRG
jgi:outer membrane lipoprotein carrier protein